MIQASESSGIIIYSKFLPAQTDNLIQIFAQAKETITTIHPAVLSVGGDSFRKGADLADNIAQHLSYNFEYHWYGFLQSPSFKRIKYCGNVPSFPYSDYNIFAFTSRSDPWPIAVLEALANGLLIVGWEHLSLISQLSKYNLAYPVPQNDIIQFARTVESCKVKVQDKNLARSFLSQYTSSVLYGKMLTKFI